MIHNRLKFTSLLLVPSWLRGRDLDWRLSYGKLVCLATLMSSDRTKPICLWMTIYIYIYIYKGTDKKIKGVKEEGLELVSASWCWWECWIETTTSTNIMPFPQIWEKKKKKFLVFLFQLFFHTDKAMKEARVQINVNKCAMFFQASLHQISSLIIRQPLKCHILSVTYCILYKILMF